MLPTSDPDRIDIAFDDHRLVADAGLLLPATLAQHLGLQELADSYLDLGDAPGRANAGDKLLTLVASALAGGDCIDDADAMRAGGTTASVLGCTVKAPSTLTAPDTQPVQLGPRPPARPPQPRVARPQLGGRSGTGRGAVHDRPRFDALRDLRPGQGGRPAAGYTGVRGYHPLLAVAAGTGEVLMAVGCARAAPTPPAAPSTSCVRRWRGCALPERRGSSRCAPTAASTTTPSSPSAQAGCPLLNHHSPAAERTPADRGDSARGLDADPVLAAGRRGCRRDDLHAVPAQGGCHPGAAHRAARQAGARLTACTLREL